MPLLLCPFVHSSVANRHQAGRLVQQYSRCSTQHTNSISAFACLRPSRSALEHWARDKSGMTTGILYLLAHQRFVNASLSNLIVPCGCELVTKSGRFIYVASSTWHHFFRTSFRAHMYIMARQRNDGAWRTAIPTPVRRRKGRSPPGRGA